MSFNYSSSSSPKKGVNSPKGITVTTEFDKVNNSPEIATVSPKEVGLDLYYVDIQKSIEVNNSPEISINDPNTDIDVHIVFRKSSPKTNVNSPKKS